MSRIAVIAEQERICGFAFAGALLSAAEDALQARAAWRALPGDIALVILSPGAFAAVQAEPSGPQGRPLCAVMPA